MKRNISQYEIDLRPLKMRFLIAATLFLVVALACVSVSRTRKLHDKTHAELVRAKAGLAKLRGAAKNRAETLARLKALLADNTDNKSPEMLIYWKVDEIKERTRTNDLTVATIEKKGEKASLPFVLKLNNHNYTEFIHTIRYLQKSFSPWAPVSSVAISQTGDPGKSGVVFTINAKVVVNEKSAP